MRPPVGGVACLGGRRRTRACTDAQRADGPRLPRLRQPHPCGRWLGRSRQTSPPQTSAGKVWPTKRVQVIVPFAPGSATDLLPRMVFEQVAANVGQTIIIENRPGRGGATRGRAAAKAEADGHTILVHSNALVTAPAIQHMPYDPVQDFAGITPLGNVPLVLVVSPDKNIKTVKDLVAAAKAKPGAINYAA